MRWLALLVLLAVPAHALVIEDPGMYYACPQGKTWDAVKQCLDKQGRPAIVRTVDGAKLVRLDQLENGAWVDGGVYLYVEIKKQWKIAGSFFGRGTDYDLQKLEALTIGKHTGFRFEIAQASPLYIQLDGLTTQRATRRVYQTMFCSPNSQYCTQAMRTCEVLVHGGAYWTFRGDLKINGNEVSVTGDRKYAGPFCAQAERVYLGWPQT